MTRFALATRYFTGPIYVLSLTALWAASTLAIWLAAALGQASSSRSTFSVASEPALTVMGLVALLISLALRHYEPSQRPEFTSPAPQPFQRGDNQWSWLLAWSAQINVLGCLALVGPSLMTPLPVALVTFTVEWLLLPKAPAALHDWWYVHWRATSKVQLPIGAMAETKQTAQATNAGMIYDGVENELNVEDEVHEENGVDEEVAWLRCARLGELPTGELFLTGWVRYEFAPGQKSVHLTVGFTPPLSSVPTIELDQEDDSSEASTADGSNEARRDGSSCEADVEHVTPAGMRIVLRRSTIESSCRGKLHWHATPRDESEVPVSTALLKTRLP